MAAPDSADDPAAERRRFLAALAASLDEGACVRLVLGKPRHAGAPRRITARPLVLKGVAHLSLVHTEATRDLTINLPLPEALAEIEKRVGTDFAHAHLLTTTEDLQLSVTKRGRWLLHRRAAERAAAEGGHDAAKRRLLDLDTPFLQALGVTDAPGRLVPAMARKWRQIARFVEIVDHAVQAAGLAARPGPLKVLDFGAGKGYLTFAVHHHLAHTLGHAVDVTGVDLKADLVRQGNAIAARLGLAGLRFVEGDVGHWPVPAVDLMIALHACDTATDHALHAGVRAGAAVIISSPCCHKQLRPQMCCPPALKPMLAHGIHLGQQAEMLTDALRALLLEAEGYATQVFEFVSLEHTSKNKMILATKLALDAAACAARRTERLAQVRELKAVYGIREQALEGLLGAA
jgi:hypothetical protein